MRRGQSLVVWAIREGRQAARSVDEALMGTSELPRFDSGQRSRVGVVVTLIPKFEDPNPNPSRRIGSQPGDGKPGFAKKMIE